MRLLFLGGCFSLLFFSVVVASAQTPTNVDTKSIVPPNLSSAVIADVNVGNARIVDQNTKGITFKLDFTNGEGEQPDVHYRAELLERKDTEHLILVHEFVFPRTIHLHNYEHVTITDTFEPPSYLSGTYEFQIVSATSNGLPLGLASLGEIKLTGSNEYIAIAPESCFLQVAGEKKGTHYTTNQGVDISTQETLIATCVAVNRGKNRLVSVPAVRVFRRSTFGEVLSASFIGSSGILTEDISMSEATFSFEGGETKTISFSLPHMTVPQAYEVVVSLFSEIAGLSGTVSNDVFFHFVLQGTSATVQNITLDHDRYAAGGKAKVFFVWTASADAFSGSRIGTAHEREQMHVSLEITNRNGEMCHAPFEQTLEKSSNTFEIVMERECVEPHVHAKLLGASGAVYDEYSFDMKSASSRNSGAIVLYGALILFAVFLLIKHGRNRNDKKLNDTLISPSV